jgi:hypothetical protein
MATGMTATQKALIRYGLQALIARCERQRASKDEGWPRTTRQCEWDTPPPLAEEMSPKTTERVKPLPLVGRGKGWG